MTAPKVVVFDYGSGNVRSVVRALAAAGSETELTKDKAAALAADGLVVPGVGAYAATVESLLKAGGAQIIDQRLAGGKSVLGICVGLQVMFDSGNEHGIHTEGLGQWPGEVEKLQAEVLPHMGWNTVEAAQDSQLFAGIENEHFYFVHSYGVRNWTFTPSSKSMKAPSVTWAEHGGDRFVAAVENGALMATQFHPEKSGAAGAKLLKNWLQTLNSRK